jgi:hypothetical protein
LVELDRRIGRVRSIVLMSPLGGLYRSPLLRGQEASSEIRKFIQSEDIPRYSHIVLQS